VLENGFVSSNDDTIASIAKRMPSIADHPDRVSFRVKQAMARNTFTSTAPYPTLRVKAEYRVLDLSSYEA